MAQRLSECQVNCLAFDPGLMPGTELARDRGAMEQFAWRYVLPLLGYVVPGISNPTRSAKTLAALLMGTMIPQTGQHWDYRGKPTRTSELSYRQDYQDQLYAVSLELTGLKN
jgi:hypothetical protein